MYPLKFLITVSVIFFYYSKIFTATFRLPCVYFRQPLVSSIGLPLGAPKDIYFGHELDLRRLTAVCIINDPKFVALQDYLSYLHYYFILLALMRAKALCTILSLFSVTLRHVTGWIVTVNAF